MSRRSTPRCSRRCARSYAGIFASFRHSAGATPISPWTGHVTPANPVRLKAVGRAAAPQLRASRGNFKLQTMRIRPAGTIMIELERRTALQMLGLGAAGAAFPGGAPFAQGEASVTLRGPSDVPPLAPDPPLPPAAPPLLP